jgi:hypothetical protein
MRGAAEQPAVEFGSKTTSQLIHLEGEATERATAITCLMRRHGAWL